MERKRALGLTADNNFSWHPRKVLTLAQNQTQFYRLHEYLNRKNAHLQHNDENLIFDIHLATPSEKHKNYTSNTSQEKSNFEDL